MSSHVGPKNRRMRPVARQLVSSVIERSRTAAGLSSFSEVNPDNAHRFAAALEQEVRPLIPEDSVRLLVSAITELTA